MKFTLSWLKERLETEANLDEIVEKLTAIGLEVESVTNPAEALSPFVVAEVLTAAPHPQADRLQVLTVDNGSGTPVQVVCGAPNARAGLKGVFGGPGAYVPGSDLTLRATSIRGVESRGMMCSVRELQIGEEHDGIIELAPDAPVGAGFAAYAGLDDPVIDVAITPNRQDAMGVQGIARDLAAAGLGRLKPIEIAEVAGTFPCPIEIRTDDPEGCPAFYGRVVRGVRNGPSPAWLQQRLKAVGQRPISALVDMTNYVSLTYGRPLHVYDLAKLEGALVARRARDGEEVLALNGKTYQLDPSMTVIADDQAVHDIGGIMGGEHSGVSETTTDIVIECAYFDPESIARTGQKLALASDARTRFERGVDPDFVEPGLQLATALAIELAGGEPSEVVRAGTPPRLERRLAYRPERCEALAGLKVTPQRQKEILERLGFACESSDAAWEVAVPSWRRDVEGQADLVEEVARIEGYDRIASTPLPRHAGVARPTATPEQKLERRARRAAAAHGLDEAVTWSFISAEEAEAVGGGGWTVANPISEDMKVMRPSLLPGLLAAARRNLARGSVRVPLFEIGARYLDEGERLTLGIVLAGEARERHWRAGRPRGFDAFDAKEAVGAILAAVGQQADRLQLLSDAPPSFHPGRSGRLGLGPATPLAVFGEVHPRVLRAFDLEGPVVAAEIYLDAIPPRRGAGRPRPAFSPSALQPVRRDFAFVVPESLAAGQLIRAVRGAERSAIADVALFDLFTGPGIAEGHKSLALEVVLQPTERSFTDEELKAVSEKIVAAAAKLGATLRG